MNRGPRSWTTSIVGAALALLVVCYCLNLAAAYLAQALPVLMPVALLIGIGIGLWQWYTRPRGW